MKVYKVWLYVSACKKEHAHSGEERIFKAEWFFVSKSDAEQKQNQIINSPVLCKEFVTDIHKPGNFEEIMDIVFVPELAEKEHGVVYVYPVDKYCGKAIVGMEEVNVKEPEQEEEKMILDERNRKAYSEEYDYPGLKQLAEMAKLHVARNCEMDEGMRGQDVPDGTYSDFSCCVWELFVETVRFGMSLQKRMDGQSIDQIKSIIDNMV